jgi:hypothetical protein
MRYSQVYDIHVLNEGDAYNLEQFSFELSSEDTICMILNL